MDQEWNLCQRCANRGDEHPLCNHYALADFEQQEAGGRMDPHAGVWGIELGSKINDWRESGGDGDDCPGFEKEEEG